MSTSSFLRDLAGLAGWLLLSAAAGGIGAVASSGAGEFYQQLTRPDWAPPGWVFGPVWTVLYALNGLAAWLVWRRYGFRGAGPALTLFVLQLGVNALWSWLFFAWQRGALAFAEVLVLDGLILATVLAFRRLHLLAAVLLLPYLAWVSFACLLTYAVWKSNPALLG